MEQLAIHKVMSEASAGEIELSQIFEAYYKRVYNYIYYRVNNSTEAEDMTSQVFEKVMLKIDTYSKSKSPFEVWLFAIARNVINDYFRSQKKFRFFSIEKVEDWFSKTYNPEETVLKNETNDKLLKALNILSTKERNIVALKFGANLRNTEIAEILGYSDSNVGVQLYRIMKKLKSELKGEL